MVDLIGHGQSASPSDAARYALELCVPDLLAILDVLDLQRANVLGYSMGGRVALRLAIEAPERVSMLLLESASPGIEDAQERAARIRSDDMLAERIERDGIAAFVAEWECQPLLQLADHVAAAVRDEQHAQRLRNDPRGLANSLRGMGAGRQAPLWDQLATLRVPTRLLVGEWDSRYRAIGERMRTVMPCVELTVSPEAGHTVHLDQPARFIEWVLNSYGN
jgi:2-succinyl-6-hydroxy-2,4-cyclohexadiene-1-carboxylate synthase